MDDPFKSGITSVKEEDQKPKVVKNPFKSAKDISAKRGLKIGIYGKPGTGKTHFSFTAPGPIYTIDTEFGTESVSKGFPNKDIQITEVYAPGTDEIWERDDVESFKQAKQALDYVYKNAQGSGTIVFDNITDIWNWCQSYVKVVLFKIPPQDRLKYQFDWGKINNLYLQTLVKLLSMPHHVILTARADEIYAGPNATGKFGPKWMKQTGYMVDIVIENKTVTKDGKMKFFSEIRKCRQHGEMMGRVYENLTFQKLQEELEICKKKKEGETK